MGTKLMSCALFAKDFEKASDVHPDKENPE